MKYNRRSVVSLANMPNEYKHLTNKWKVNDSLSVSGTEIYVIQNKDDMSVIMKDVPVFLVD